MATALLAIGLVLIVEGLAWALAPSAIEQMLAMLRQMTIEARRLAGLTAMAIGVLICWVAYALGA